jgi:uncharacterized protein (TIGR03067 family)
MKVLSRARSESALLAALILSASVCAACGGAEAGKLQGEWVLLLTADEKRISPGCADCKMVVSANGRVELKLGDRTTNRGTITLTRAGKDNLVDLKLTTGLFLGVHELKGDDLVICFSEAGAPRPAGMKPRGKQWAEHWRRARPRPATCVLPPAERSEGP